MSALRGGARRLTLLALLVPLAAAECGRPPAQDEAAPTAAGPPGATAQAPGSPPVRPTLTELQALPYQGYTRQKADRTRQGVVLLDRARSAPGYDLYTTRDLCTAELISATGRLLHAWHMEGCDHWGNVELLPDGDLLVVGEDHLEGRHGRRAEVEARFLARLSWEGKARWKTRITAHHDVELTPRGELLTLTAGYRRLPAIDPDVDVFENGLALLSPADGRVLARAPLYEMLAAAPAVFTFKRVEPEVKKGKKRPISLFHCNSVEWMRRPELAAKDPIYALSNVLVSCRHQDSVFIVDWDARRVVWAWGQGTISGPHDATVLDDGHILLFDNGLDRGWSRALEIDPLARRVVWEYRAPNPTDLFTPTRGSAQRLANGDTLISDSDGGRAFEVTPGGDVVWELLNPHFNGQDQRATISRLRRYDPATIDALRAHHPAG